MIRKPNRSDAKRLTTGVLVAGVVAAGAVALAGPAAAAAATQLTITPKTADAGYGACVEYTVSELDGNGAAATTGTAPTVTATGSTGVSAATYSNAGCTTATSTGTQVGATQQYTFYVEAATTSTAASGSVSIKASIGASINATATLNVAANVNDFVKGFTVVPGSGATADANSTVPYLVTPTDANGNPVVGATVLYQFSAANTDNACTSSGSETPPSGTIECDVPAGTANSTVTFYVNNSSSTSSGLDSAVEPSSTPSAITVQTAKTVHDVTLTCTNQGKNGDGAADDCLAPTGTSSETFSALVQNLVNSAEVPVSGAVVTFAVTSGSGTLSTLTATTNASGVATVTLKPSSTTADQTDTVRATSGGVTDSATVAFQTPAADQILITPGDETVQIGSTVTETAKVVDQFGNAVAGEFLDVYTTDSRNDAEQDGITGANGTITLSYQDTGTTAGTDTVEAEDETSDIDVQDATVHFVASVTPTAAALNFGGSATTCATNTTDPADEAGDTDNVCVLVTNANGTQPLANAPVTFTVNEGTVADNAADAQAAAATTTYTTTTNDDGIALAVAYSTKSGAQTITATAGSGTTVTSNTLTDTRTYDSNDDDYSVTLTPTTAAIPAGQSQQFVATAVDQYGNPVTADNDFDYVEFTASGPGTLNNSFGYIGSQGTVAVLLATTPGSTGTGTVSAELDFGSGDIATSTYSVVPVVAKTVSVELSGAKKIGAAGTATATVTGTDNKQVSGEVVNFTVTGATTTSGTATTNGNGVATFNFTAKHAGSFKVTATASSASVSGSATGSTASNAAKQVTAKLTLTSTKKHQIQETATLNVKLKGVSVHFYTVSNGKRKLVGSTKTGPKGMTVFTVKGLKSGTTYKATARPVSLPNGYKGGKYAPTKSHKVK